MRFSSGTNKKFNRNYKYKLVKVLKIHYGIHTGYYNNYSLGWLSGSVVTDEPQWATKPLEHIPLSACSLRPQPWLTSHQGKEPLTIYTFTCSFKTYSYMYLLYRHRWNTRIFPVTKIWYRVKIQFLSFTCEDIMVVMATSVSANRKRA